MEAAISTLKARFTLPSTSALEDNRMCRICWCEYEGKDRAVELPCGHIFGEECILTWGQTMTWTGNFQGCPFCQKDFLPPPTWYFWTVILFDWLCFMLGVIAAILGGRTNLIIFCCAAVVNTAIEQWPDLDPNSYVALGLFYYFHIFPAWRVYLNAEGSWRGCLGAFVFILPLWFIDLLDFAGYDIGASWRNLLQ